MPNSYTFFKQEIKQWFLENIPTSKRILDVGPGEGTYADLLHSIGYRIDAVEIYAPYVEQFNLRSKYDNVYIDDILNFNINYYDVVILGDVLEHLSIEQAQQFINKIEDLNKQCLVAVPYMMSQGEVDGNVHEAHKQEDLTHEIMKERYSSLVCLYKNEHYGYYTLPNLREDKMYVLYATRSYINTVQGAVDSIRKFSNIPIMVYLLDYYTDIEGATVFPWECDVVYIPQEKFIDRLASDLYPMMIQRPLIVKDALEKYAKIVAYIDADSIATSNIDRIFDLAKDSRDIPYFVKGIYDYFYLNGRGGSKMEETLEYPACKLFNVSVYDRLPYRQSGYFVATQHSIEFLNKWSWMCNHPEVLKNPQLYAPFHEETIVNVLLWSLHVKEGLPLIYMNVRMSNFTKVLNDSQWGKETEMWVKYPDKSENLLFLHGEKDIENMIAMLKLIPDKVHVPEEVKPMRILFLAPHLSTGGMPAFLLKRIEALLLNPIVEIYVVEWECVSLDFVVQRNKIMKLVKNFYSLGEDKNELIEIIKTNQIDIIHIDEMVEHLAYCPFDLKLQLYTPDRKYRIVETCHNVIFKPDVEKTFHPDAYAFCTPYHLDVFQDMPSYKEVIQFPIEYKRVTYVEQSKAQDSLGMTPGISHVLNVGLWTKGKNQGEGLEIARKYSHMHFHFVGNRAGNFKDYWEPLMKDIPSNVTIWDEREDVELFYQAADIFMFNSTFECSPLALREAIGYALPIIARNLSEYRDMFTPYLQPIDSDLNTLEINYTVPNDNTTDDFAKDHYNLYSEILKLKSVPMETVPSKINIIQYFVNNPYLEITGESLSKYLIKFFDEAGVCHYEHTTTANHWVKLDRTYFTKWTTMVWEDGVLIYENILNFKQKRVFIVFESKALGDTIAWMPYCLEFKKKHSCDVFVCTFHNSLFKKTYPELTFVEPGSTVNNLMGMYHITSHNDHDKNKEPENTVAIPLQKVACNILGLEYTEIRPMISFSQKYSKYNKKYVVIATNSTAGCKFWQKADWQKVIDYLVEQDLLVINVSKEKNQFENCTQILDDSINNTMNVIHYSEFFIGLSSGLSWLAWAMKKEVVMIANFTNLEYEFSCHRIVNTKVCHGCFNNPEYKFDKTWDWCPFHKGTDRQWECQRAITGEQVIEKLKELL